MPFLIAGLLLFWMSSIVLRKFSRSNPVVVARLVRRGGGALVFAAAIFVLLRGRIDVAIALSGLGFWLVKGGRPGSTMFGGARRGRKVSRVRSAMIEMELDHLSGAMTGSILAGPDEGASLDQLSQVRCLALFNRCLADDPEGARLLEAYFDRRFTGWRNAGDHGHHAGRAEDARRDRRRPGSMSEDEAHQVLGLAKSATREDITRAHRTLMKKLHPDHGGSTDLAARVNEAKDVLMRRHP